MREMAQHRILTVDDDTGILRVLREILTRNGYDVVGAQDGAEALLRVRSRAFRLITMDLNNGPDGWCGYYLCAAERV